MSFKTICLRTVCLLLSLCLLCVGLTACSGGDEIPDGYQYATCAGEYFRLFVPTQWTVNTESGLSGAYLSIDPSATIAVTMCESAFGADTEDATLDDFRSAHRAEVSTLRDYAEESAYASNVSGYKAQNLVYTATVAGIPVKYRQMLCKVGGRFFLFTYSAPADKFDNYVDIVGEIVENIQFYATPFEGEDIPTRKVPDDEDAPAGMRLISTDEVAFRFYAPEAWETDPSSVLNAVYVTEADGSRSNVTMTAYMPEDEGYSVDDYWKMCALHYEDTLKDFTVTSITSDSKLGGRSTVTYEYTYKIGSVSYKTRQSMCVYTTMVYIMTYTALPEHFDNHTDDVKRMEQSLTFRSPFARKEAVTVGESS